MYKYLRSYVYCFIVMVKKKEEMSGNDYRH